MSKAEIVTTVSVQDFILSVAISFLGIPSIFHLYFLINFLYKDKLNSFSPQIEHWNLWHTKKLAKIFLIQLISKKTLLK